MMKPLAATTAATSAVVCYLLARASPMCAFSPPSSSARRHNISFLRSNPESENALATDLVLPPFGSRQEFESYLQARAIMPAGFRCGSAPGRFIPVEAPSMGALKIQLTLVALDTPTDVWGAVFTRNLFPGAPVTVGRERLASGAPLQALAVNNKVSNVCAGGDGAAATERVCAAAAAALGLAGGGSAVLPSSTGVIGWRLPAEELAGEVVPAAAAELAAGGGDAFTAARAIMTTDRYPKLRSRTLKGGARVVGIAKGAGMIEPNMATMLSYIFTDAAGVDRATLQSVLARAVDASYNSISVDGDESTSDTVAILSSSLVPLADGPEGLAEFEEAVREVTAGLSADIVRNGEGTKHVIRVQVRGCPGTDKLARSLGRHVVNSPLFKCAVAGNDPNTGRIAAAIGSFLGKLEGDVPDGATDLLTISLGGRIIFSGGNFVLEGDEVEAELSAHMRAAEFGEADDYPRHQKFVEVGIDFGTPGGNAIVLGSDLTAEYVAVNADYRS
eukprot:CAMPEP_0194276042 /NCGR_PEP_ID=MMETSP0169-20130528/8725_1 /TAXON_ID=218684 /ORGANISM="Corethron pennatum, Strain L29A3" /LENGTH=502 /DNA_ID=CAMNT_0039019659 /DNA_START=47 /DNA_END=1555 /DNA_ORIENTATION=-